MVQEDKKILHTKLIWCHKHKWIGHVLWNDGLLHAVLDWKEGC